MPHRNSAHAPLDPAALAARLRAAQERTFTGRAPLTVGEAAFKALRLDQVERVTLSPDGAIEAEAVEVEELPSPPEPVAPPAPDPALRLAEVRAEALAEGRAQGRDEGLAEGLARGRAEAEAELAAARAAFVTVARSLGAAGPDLSDRLAEMMAAAVRALAAQRAGQAIDTLPAAFIARIAQLADRVAQGMRTVTLRLNPDDLAAIAPHLSGTDLDGATLSPDPALRRGDVEVRADGIRLADLMGA